MSSGYAYISHSSRFCVPMDLHIRREASVVFLPLAGIAKPQSSVKSKQLHALLLYSIGTQASCKTRRIGHFAGWDVLPSPINTGVSKDSNVSDTKFAVENAL